jgi:hypothetical protein
MYLVANPAHFAMVGQTLFGLGFLYLFPYFLYKTYGLGQILGWGTLLAPPCIVQGGLGFFA